MYLPFEQLSPKARVWVYQTSEKLTSEEKDRLTNEMERFCDQWAAHGNPLKSSFSILNDHFLVVVADEKYNQASGCSIDSSVKTLKAITQQIDKDFFDRLQVAFLLNDEVRFYPVNDLRNLFQSGLIKAGDLTFNTLINSKDELDTNWLVPVEKSWLAKYLPKTALA